MNFGKIISYSPLIHLGKGTGRTADPDKGKPCIGNKRYVFQLFSDIFLTGSKGSSIGIALGCKFFGQCHGTDGYGDGLFNFPVADKG